MMDLTALVLVDRNVLLPGQNRFVAGAEDREVVETLRTFLKHVVLRPYTSVPDFVTLVKEIKPSLIFNLTEHSNGDRTKDSHISALIDLCNIPYTGTGPEGMILCRDKALSKLVAEQEGFRIPEFFTTNANKPRLPSRIKFPLVVKPRFRDSSEGIHQTSLVQTKEALLKQIAGVGRSRRDDAVICEEYIPGRDILVGIVGRQVMLPREFFIENKGANAPRLASFRFKHDSQYRRRWKVRVGLAQLTSRQRRFLDSAALRTFRELRMRDYGRLDIRLTPSGEWFFIEANPNPALIAPAPFSGSCFANHRKLIKEIAQEALRRKK